MIAIDSSALITYLAGGRGAAMDALDIILAEQQACLPPVALTELTSDPGPQMNVPSCFDRCPCWT